MGAETLSAEGDEESRTCKSCDRTSVLGHIDWWGRCPACRQTRSRLSIDYVVSKTLLMAVVIGAHLAPLEKVVAILAIWPLGLLNTVTHETTHALVARLLGWRVHIVALGSWEPRRLWRLGGTLLVIHRDFFTESGSCLASPAAGTPSRGAIALYVAAPMLADVAAAVALLPWASVHALGGTVVTLFVMTNLLAAARSAWPRDVPSIGAVTDGKALLDLVMAPEVTLASWGWRSRVSSLHARMLEGKHEEAFRETERSFALDPESEVAAARLAFAALATGRVEQALPHAAAHAKSIESSRSRSLLRLPDRDLAAHGHFRGRELEEYTRASFLVALDRLDEALAISERGVETATSAEARALWQGCVALALMMIGRDLDRAEEAARRAYERLPWVPFVETAWGMARIERGDSKEGLAAFERVRKVDPEGRTAGLRTAWTVVATGFHETLPAHAWPSCRRRAERALSGPR